MERIAYDYETLHAINLNLIYLSMSGFGPDGPAAERRVYDLVIQAVSAMVAAQAVSSALFARERGHVAGHLIELTMLEANLAFLWPDVFWNHSFVGDNVEEKPLISEFISTTPTADGHAAMFTVGDDEFAGACEVLNYPEAHDDPRFATVTDRFANGPELMDEFRKRTVNFDTDGLVAQMEEAQVPCAKVNDYDEVISDPRVTHRGSIIEYDQPLGGRVRQARAAAIFDGEPCSVRQPWVKIPMRYSLPWGTAWKIWRHYGKRGASAKIKEPMLES